MRLIDADELRVFLDRQYHNCHGYMGNKKEIYRDALRAVKSYVHREGQIDAELVRHARWVDNHCTSCGMMPIGDEMWRHCDFEPPRFEWFMDYCPNCGAKMDGERKENDNG